MHHFVYFDMLGITTYKYYTNFLGTGTCFDVTNYYIFLYLYNMSNFMFDCNFLRHTGHS